MTTTNSTTATVSLTDEDRYQRGLALLDAVDAGAGRSVVASLASVTSMPDRASNRSSVSS
jgi:hypothetical protein